MKRKTPLVLMSLFTLLGAKSVTMLSGCTFTPAEDEPLSTAQQALAECPSVATLQQCTAQSPCSLNLSGCDYSNAQLPGFYNTGNMSGTIFAGANLVGAFLGGNSDIASFVGANLAGATLEKNASGADLAGANVTGTTFNGNTSGVSCTNLVVETLPGSSPPAAGLPTGLSSSCLGNISVTCPPPAACFQPGVANQGTGWVCQYAVQANGTSCDDGNACTLTDTCQSGACTGESDPCLNGGTCTNDVTSYTCQCPTGSLGTNCEISCPCRVDPTWLQVTANPAGGGMNDGTAGLYDSTLSALVFVDPSAGTCEAADYGQPYGFLFGPPVSQTILSITPAEAQACLQDMGDPCASTNPCQNGGTCAYAGPNSYTCSCPSPWIGTNCESLPACTTADPCQNGGTCVNQNGGMTSTCACPAGTYGQNCENTTGASCPTELTPVPQDVSWGGGYWDSTPSATPSAYTTIRMVATFRNDTGADLAFTLERMPYAWVNPNCSGCDSFGLTQTVNEYPPAVVPPGGTFTYDITFTMAGAPGSGQAIGFQPQDSHFFGNLGPTKGATLLSSSFVCAP
ncbi:pentapeptide repeat-containing protein [Sorangium sp. So ce128]|uniref:pentapeptide repeat-containing protein n=1 Tax=Sorangium sp. So ce128 TaxID=3133281 RepID=UPI003F609865